MVGKKAEYASGDVKGQTRKFGVITKDGDVDVPGFKKELAKYKGTVTSEATYPPTGGDLRRRDARRAIRADDRHEDEGRRRDHDGAVHRRGDEQGAHGAGEQAGVVPGVVPHREQLRRLLGVREDPPTRPGRALLRDLGQLAVPHAFDRSGDRDQGQGGIRSTGSGGRRITPRRPGWETASPGCWRAFTPPDPTSRPRRSSRASSPFPLGGSASNSPFGAQVGYGRTTGLPYDEYNRAPADYLLFIFVKQSFGVANDDHVALSSKARWGCCSPSRLGVGTLPRPASEVRELPLQGELGDVLVPPVDGLPDPVVAGLLVRLCAVHQRVRRNLVGRDVGDRLRLRAVLASRYALDLLPPSSRAVA